MCRLKLNLRILLHLAVIVSLDKRFVALPVHEEILKAIRKPLTYVHLQNRKQTFDVLRKTTPHIAYFYCHGGINPNNVPYLSIGSQEYITPDNFRAYGIHWQSTRPLVFLKWLHDYSLGAGESVGVRNFVRRIFRCFRRDRNRGHNF